MILSKKIYTTLVFILCFCAFYVDAEVVSTPESIEKGIIKIQEYPDLQMTELTLSNGMKVVLKYTDDDSEISVRLAALGGYASVNSGERASGELAASIVIDSGIGDLCADKLSAYLYDHSIEFNLKIEPFMRGIDASLPEESLEAFFDLINQTFVAPKFCSKAFITSLEKKRSELARKGEESSINDILNLVSTQEQQALKPLKAADLDKADLEKAKQFFLSAFSNPADFVCVIAGDINIEKVKKLSVQYFSSIPARNTDQKFLLPSYNQAPKVIATRTQNLPYSKESLVRLAFPLQIKLDHIQLEQLELVCQIVEGRLRNIVKSHTYDAKGVDVWYELPLYPSLEHPWLTIQFHVENNHIQPTIDLVFEELKKMCRKGPSFEEIKLAAKIKRQSLQLWEHDNDYWIVLLSNHYLWGWNPEIIFDKFKNYAIMDPKEIHSAISKSLLIDEYTLRQ